MAQHQQTFRPHVEKQIHNAQVGQEAKLGLEDLIIGSRAEGGIRLRVTRTDRLPKIVAYRGLVTIGVTHLRLQIDQCANQLAQRLVEIKQEGEEIIVTRPNDLKRMKSLHGLTRTLINNMVIGVTNGYEKVLEVNGVGYRAAKSGNKLTLSLGYSHPVEMIDPEGVETVLEGQNKITVKGIDKEKVGQYAAEIREKRAPEPYKGKGIKYSDEVIRRRVCKTGKK